MYSCITNSTYIMINEEWEMKRVWDILDIKYLKSDTFKIQ